MATREISSCGCARQGDQSWPCEQHVEPTTAVTHTVWNIEVFQEDDGQYAATWESADGKVAGMGNYSSTPIGALAELCATLIKVAEDDAKDRATGSQ